MLVALHIDTLWLQYDYSIIRPALSDRSVELPWET